MASPRPMAVVRLRAKTDTSVTERDDESTRNVPTIASDAHDQREPGGDDAAEHEHQQDQRDRERDELGPQEVLSTCSFAWRNTSA